MDQKYYFGYQRKSSKENIISGSVIRSTISDVKGLHSKKNNQDGNHDHYPINNKSPYADGNTISGSVARSTISDVEGNGTW